MRRYFRPLLDWIVGGTFGLLLGVLLCKWGQVEFAGRVTIGDLFSFATSLTLVFLARVAYARQIADERAERDLVIDGSKDILAALADIESYVNENLTVSPLPDTHKLIGYLQRFDNSLLLVKEFLGLCKISTTRRAVEELEELRSQQRDLLTDTPFPGRFETGARRTHQGMALKIRRAVASIVVEANRA